jgi:uncharacterized repeat protein (TIGR03803 family)
LVSIGNLLYGTALAGSSSSSNYGTVYQINTNGSGFTNVYNFTGGSDGAGPIRTLALSGNTFYGATAAGGVAFGTNGNGTIFALTLPVSLSIARSNTSNILSWPSPSTGFVLQTNADATTTNWGNYGAAVDDGTNQTVTVPSSPGSLFFRLSHP